MAEALDSFEEVSSISCLLAAKFTADNESIAVLTEEGLQEIRLQTVDHPQASFIPMKGAYIIERIQDHLVVVLRKCPESLNLWYLENGLPHTSMLEAQFIAPILAVTSWRETNDGQWRLLVCFQASFSILDLKLTILRVIEVKAETCQVFALCPSNGGLAFPSNKDYGYMKIMYISSEEQDKERHIHAHESPITAMAFTHSGSSIATASARGTVIRMFCVLTGHKIHEFRRGYARTVDVNSLSFCKNDEFLALASDKETVHVFQMERPRQNNWRSYLGSMAASTGWFGQLVKSSYEQDRAFACANIPTRGTGQICAIVGIEGKSRLVVLNLEQDLFIFDIPLRCSTAQTNGRLCQLIKHHKMHHIMFDDADDLTNTTNVTLVTLPSTTTTTTTLPSNISIPSRKTSTSSGPSVSDYSRWKEGLRESKHMPYASSAPTGGASFAPNLSTSSPILKKKNASDIAVYKQIGASKTIDLILPSRLLGFSHLSLYAFGQNCVCGKPVFHSAQQAQ